MRLRLSSLFNKKKSAVPPISPPTEKTREQLDGEEWVPELRNSEWIEGVHPDVVSFNKILRHIRIAGLGVLAAIVIHFIIFCAVALAFNITFSAEFSLFVFGVKNINPFHAIGVYMVIAFLKFVAELIADEFNGFEFFSGFEDEEDKEPPIIVLSDEQMAKKLKKQDSELRKIKKTIRSLD